MSSRAWLSVAVLLLFGVAVYLLVDLAYELAARRF